MRNGYFKNKMKADSQKQNKKKTFVVSCGPSNILYNFHSNPFDLIASCLCVGKEKVADEMENELNGIFLFPFSDFQSIFVSRA